MVAKNFRLALPPELFAAKPRLADYLGRPLMLGVRPEALSRADEGASLTGRVAFVEDFGATQLAHLDIDFGESLRELAAEPDEQPIAAPRLRALLDASPPLKAGDRLSLGLDARRIHLFDAETEHAL